MKLYSLYAIRSGDHTKIGYSSNVSNRIREIQCSSPFDVEVVWLKVLGSERSYARRAETAVHSLCEGYHIRGEWFDFQVITALRNIVSIDDCISITEGNLAASIGYDSVCGCHNDPCPYCEDAIKWRVQQDAKKQYMRKKRTED